MKTAVLSDTHNLLRPQVSALLKGCDAVIHAGDIGGRQLAEDIRAAIGPNIAGCHFETDSDVPQAMTAAFGPEAERYMEKRGEKYHLDLKAINAMVLRRAGVRHIECSPSCTVCRSDRFWSHRVTAGVRGSQGAVILCQGRQS